MEKFRWAYIGSGSIAKNTARSITKGPHAITAVYSRNTEKARAFGARYGAEVFESFGALLSDGDFDGVYIATPHTSHIEYAMGAMKAGKPVLCEKPMGVNTAEVDAMTECARENGVYLCEAMWTWFSDVALTVKQLINGKKTGDIKSVRIEYGFPGLMAGKGSRLLMPETAGGALLDIGVYPITYCYNLFGYPETIMCEGTVKNGIDAEETVTLGYGGFDCVLEMSLAKLKESCRITGTEGSIDIPMFHMARLAVVKTKNGRETVTGKTDYLTEFTRAAQEIKDGKTVSGYVPLSATRDCMTVMDACRRQMGLVYPFEAQGTP